LKLNFLNTIFMLYTNKIIYINIDIFINGSYLGILVPSIYDA
jgi:hypothetical protein